MTDYGHNAPAAVTYLAVAQQVDEIAEQGFTVHTITMILNGQHGQFDLRIVATDDDMDEFEWRGIAHISGGVDMNHYCNEVVA